MRLWLWQARLKLRRFFGFMAIINDLSQRLLEAEDDIRSLECDKVDESDLLSMENDITNIENRLDTL